MERLLNMALLQIFADAIIIKKKIDIHLKNGEDVSLQHNRECGEQIKSYFLKDEVETIHSTEPNLETVFMELTGRKFEL